MDIFGQRRSELAHRMRTKRSRLCFDTYYLKFNPFNNRKFYVPATSLAVLPENFLFAL
ncbi:hypothetical protein LguiB_001298 [Lonicera macranthoides]